MTTEAEPFFAISGINAAAGAYAAHEIYFNTLCPALVGEILERCSVADTKIVDKNVRCSAEGLKNVGDHLVRALRSGKISRHDAGPAGSFLIKNGLIAIGHDHAGAFLGQQIRSRFTDTVGAGVDDCEFPF